MGREPGHGVDLQEPRASIVDDEVGPGDIATPQQVECGQGAAGTRLGRAGRTVGVQFIPGIVAEVLGLVVVEGHLRRRDDLDQRHRLAAHDAGGDLSARDELLGHDGSPTPVEDLAGCRHLLFGAAHVQVDAGPVIDGLEHQRRNEGAEPAGGQAAIGRCQDAMGGDDSLGRLLVHGDGRGTGT